MRHLIKLLVPLAALTLLSCSPSRKQQAEQIYDMAIDAFSAKKMGVAKSLVDSLKTSYADIPQVYREARDLEKIIARYEIERTVAFLDSSLEQAELAQRDLMKDMVVDDPDASVPVYIARAQQAWRSFNRCYIKARTDANGLFSLSTNYVGELPIHHDHVEVRSGDDFLTLPVVSDGAFKNTFKNDEYVWETLRYEGQQAADLARFISNFQTERIAVDYCGSRSHYLSVMTEADKLAIQQVWNLSCSFRESRKIRSMLRSARIEMNRHSN